MVLLHGSYPWHEEQAYLALTQPNVWADFSAARQAGLLQVLVRVLRRLSYLERCRKQLEENRLRSSLDPVEEAHAILQTTHMFETAPLEAAMAMDRGSWWGERKRFVKTAAKGQRERRPVPSLE